MHLVHQNLDDDSIAVVSVLFNSGAVTSAAADLLDSLLNYIDVVNGTVAPVVTKAIDIEPVLATASGFYSYNGYVIMSPFALSKRALIHVCCCAGTATNIYFPRRSLTTPPCTEGVTWLVQATQVEIREDQVARIFEQVLV